MKKHINYATLLRAIAAILITNSHYIGVYPNDIIANGGLLGDVIFFALSGFVLVNIKTTFISWYKKRLIRIYPTIWIITFVYISLGYYTYQKWNLFSYFIFPTYYHFITSIILLYIPYYFIIKYESIKSRLQYVIYLLIGIQLSVYVFIYDKSYYHIDIVREPMIRFLFLISMIMGAYFRLNHKKYKDKFSFKDWITMILIFVAYFLSKLSLLKFAELSFIQILNQYILIALLYFIFRCFSGIESKINKIPIWIKSIYQFIAMITLQIYAVQYVIIPRFAYLIFPINWLVITALIIVAAFLLYIVSYKVSEIFYKLVDGIGSKLIAWGRKMKYNEILLTGAYQYADKQIEILTNMGMNITYVVDERRKLKIDVDKFEIVICNSLFQYNDISKFTNLRYIQLTSAGLDRIPIDYINENDIIVKNAGDVYAIPMAEWTVLKILEIYKQSKYFYENQRLKRWIKNRDLLEIRGRKIGVVGCGNVGTEIAKRLKAFDTEVLGFDIKKVEDKCFDEVYFIESLEEVIGDLDILVLSLPLNSKTMNFLNDDKFNRMKNGISIINISRGGN